MAIFADNNSILCVRIYALLVCSYCFGILFLHGRRRCPVWTLVRIRELMSVNSRMRMSVPMGAVPYFRENREFVSCWFRVLKKSFLQVFGNKCFGRLPASLIMMYVSDCCPFCLFFCFAEC